MEEKLWHGRKSMTNIVSILEGERFIWTEGKQEYRRHIKKQRHHFVDTGSYSQIYGFSSSHAWMWELNHKEWWALKKLCFQTVVLEKTLESPLGSKEIKPVIPKGNQLWIFVGRTDAEAEAPTLWPPDVKNQLVRKDPYAGKDGRWEGDDRGWDGWMAPPTQWTWDSEDREAALLPSTQSQSVRHDLATEQQQRYACLCVCV